MLILIAESKTMTECAETIDRTMLEYNLPIFNSEAAEIMDMLSEKNIDQLASLIGISQNLARAMKRMAFEFPVKTLGESALYAYTGVVFKALDPKSLTPTALVDANNRLRIISSLYGWLRPDDIVKQYRLEFKSKANSQDIPMYNFWKKNLTEELCKYLVKNKCKEILDLMPGDAAKCIDWKKVSDFADTWKIDLLTHKDGILKTPDAGKLKKLRGCMLRQILTENIDSIEGVKSLQSENYVFDKIDSCNHKLVFISA